MTILWCWWAGMCLALGDIRVEEVPGQAELGYVEIHGVAAGDFDPAIWQRETFHLLADIRHPLLSPRVDGVFRNIYAPSVVALQDGWRLFYGAWDGVATPNDRIYSVETADFLDFGPRRTVIEHGDFIHVCNVNALAREGGFEMMCTVLPPGEPFRNKPAYFFFREGAIERGEGALYSAGLSDVITIEGYPNYAEADINGVNAILREEEQLRLYFCNFNDFGRVYRAMASDGKQFTFEGPVLECPMGVNDVKRFDVKGAHWYLMGLHRNRNATWYSLSPDGLHFEPVQPLLRNLDDADRYIVALGWVCRDNRLLGVLYGAGPVPQLNRNRIFARWLQRKLVFVAEDRTRYEPGAALGPDRQLIPVPADFTAQGEFYLYAEDGMTQLAGPFPVTLGAQRVYRIRWDATDSSAKGKTS